MLKIVKSFCIFIILIYKIDRLELKLLVRRILYIIAVLVTLTYLVSCEDEKYASSSDVQLQFSVDTVMFDTIFTTIGSTTKNLRVYNPYDQKVLISSVKLAGGENSNFRLNINGFPYNEILDLEIPANDSIYIFVEVTVDPNGGNIPMVVKDSIEFITNANIQDVDLVAWGQDYNLIRNARIKTTTWTADKPYLVYDAALVDSLSTLTIEAGTKVYFHDGAGLFVKGNIIARGTAEQPIVFQGDRLEDVYEDVPDQWDGVLLFSGSHNNSLEHVEIKNANIGLQVGNIENEGFATAKLSGVKIQNMAYAGIFALRSEIEADNCLITNCGFYGAALLIGGTYEFNHTTIANYWGGFSTRSRSTSSLVLSNLLIIDQEGEESVTYVGDLTKAKFGNCIVAGNITSGNEVELGRSDDAEFNFKFDHCLLQLSDTFNISKKENFADILKGIDPKFIDPHEKLNFELDTLSPAKDAGSVQIGARFPLDIKGDSRTDDGAPDLGAYERIEKSSD